MIQAEKAEISIHEVRVWMAFDSQPDAWITNKELADTAGVAGRTARAHTLKLVRLGILDEAAVFPGHRYRLSGRVDKRNAGYLLRLRSAAEAFGVAN
jgi:hypothetical protein